MDYNKIDWNQAVQNTLADYEKAKTTKPNSERKEVDLSKYFTLTLPDKVNSGERIIRILPIDTNGKWYEIGKFHSLKIGKNWTKLYDPAQDGEESPLNDMYKILINGDKEDKTLANSYRSRDFYIIRCIERGKEHEGVKFWRFNKVNDGSGIMDKLVPLMKHLDNKKPGAGAIFRPDAEGRDITISLVRDVVKGFPKVAQIMLDDPSPLSTNADDATAWLSNEMTWKTIYKKKPIEFLRIVAEGFEPAWDSESKKFVAKSDDMGGTTTYVAPTKDTTYAEPTDMSAPEDMGSPISLDTEDLPF
jgi:hypothetical protein